MSSPEPLCEALVGFTWWNFLYSTYLPIGFLITGQHGHPSRNIQPQIEQDWQNRPLDEVYLILYIDAIHYSIRDNNVIRKLAAYIILGINTERKKKFWLSVLVIMKVQNISFLLWTNWKTGDIKDVLAIYADGLTGIKEAIATAFPKTEYQRCIVHQVRNTLKYVPDKDRKTFVTDLKIIYQTCNEFHLPESELKHRRSVFPSDTALLRALYLATFEATQKWTSTQQSGIGRRYMVSWVLCMKTGYQNNKKQAGNRLLLTCYSTTVIYKARVKSLVFKLLTLSYHRRILFTEIFS